MDPKRLLVILERLEVVMSLPLNGDFIEFGCFIGTTSLFIQRLLIDKNITREFHVYDSFMGLPHKTIQDASVAGSDFKAGELKASRRELIHNFKKASLPLPRIHKDWFADLKDKDLPDSISFAFIDGDFYQSIIDCLKLTWPRIETEGEIIIDDYNRSNLPGVTRAVEDFFTDKAVNIKHVLNLAIIRKV